MRTLRLQTEPQSQLYGITRVQFRNSELCSVGERISVKSDWKEIRPRGVVPQVYKYTVRITVPEPGHAHGLPLHPTPVAKGGKSPHRPPSSDVTGSRGCSPRTCCQSLVMSMNCRCTPPLLLKEVKVHTDPPRSDVTASGVCSCRGYDGGDPDRLPLLCHFRPGSTMKPSMSTVYSGRTGTCPIPSNNVRSPKWFTLGTHVPDTSADDWILDEPLSKMDNGGRARELLAINHERQ
ncbi:hypothetical protein J6590_028627 [Homalodisca vitripennis]|nr:hypothetical protein J6590_028627 [Homalodisca vitripennis]